MYMPCICRRSTYTWYIPGIFQAYTGERGSRCRVYTMYIQSDGYTCYIQGYTMYMPCICRRLHIPGIYQAYSSISRHIPEIGVPDVVLYGLATIDEANFKLKDAKYTPSSCRAVPAWVQPLPSTRTRPCKDLGLIPGDNSWTCPLNWCQLWPCCSVQWQGFCLRH